MTPLEGQTVGSFVLRHKISDGGMGSVWAAEHLTLHREVAVKFLTRPGTDPDAVERFLLEARTVARISSPHIPQVFDQGVCPDGTLYIVMELIAGLDLKTWVGERGCLTLAQLNRLVEQICLAMTAAHELGIVHRDIKPENIILNGNDADFHATLVDFGIAKSTMLSLSAPQLTLAGATMGTPSYMSPEQLLSVSNVDERSDVWSLGVVSYWALLGRLPFDGVTFAAVCCAINAGHFVPASEVRHDLPVELDRWFDKVLNRDLDQRFQSAALMSGMLKVAVARPSEWTRRMPVVRSEPPQPLEPAIGGTSHTAPPFVAARWRWRDSALAAAGGGAFALLVLLGIGRQSSHHSVEDSQQLTAAKVEVAGTAATAPPTLPAEPLRAVLPEPIPSAQVPWVPSPVHDTVPVPDVTFNHGPDPVERHLRATVAASSARSTPSAPKPGPLSVASAAPAALDAGPSVPGPSDWHPHDDLGEP